MNLLVVVSVKYSPASNSENSATQFNVHEKVVQDLISCMTEFDCDAFDVNKPPC